MTPTQQALALEALRELVYCKDMKDRLKRLHAEGQGTDYTDYYRLQPLAWDKARAAIAALEAAPTGAAQAAGEVPSPDANCTFETGRGWATVGPHGGLKERMPSPTPMDLVDPMFEAIWQTTKSWDVNSPEHYQGYCGMNGSHVMLILNAIRETASTPSAEPGAEVPMPEPNNYLSGPFGLTVFPVFTADQLRTYGDSRAAAAVAADRVGRRPLTDEQIEAMLDAWDETPLRTLDDFARAIERAHGIGGIQAGE